MYRVSLLVLMVALLLELCLHVTGGKVLLKAEVFEGTLEIFCKSQQW